MKRTNRWIAAVAAATLLSSGGVLAQGGKGEGKGKPAAQAKAGPDEISAAEAQKLFYALGYSVGKSLDTFDMSKPEIAQLKKGLDAAIAGKPGPGDLQEQQAQISKLAEQRGKKKAQVTKGKERAAAEKYAKEKGAEKSASGLVYIPLKKGTGAQPAPTDTVKVHYKGTLTDGTEFDSSYKRNEPAEFPLNGVIPCWTEGLQKMKVGGKARLVCPSEIAYGDMGRPPVIPGGATLVFDVELLEVKGK